MGRSGESDAPLETKVPAPDTVVVDQRERGAPGAEVAEDRRPLPRVVRAVALDRGDGSSELGARPLRARLADVEMERARILTRGRPPRVAFEAARLDHEPVVPRPREADPVVQERAHDEGRAVERVPAREHAAHEAHGGEVLRERVVVSAGRHDEVSLGTRPARDALAHRVEVPVGAGPAAELELERDELADRVRRLAGREANGERRVHGRRRRGLGRGRHGRGQDRGEGA